MTLSWYWSNGSVVSDAVSFVGQLIARHVTTRSPS